MITGNEKMTSGFQNFSERIESIREVMQIYSELSGAENLAGDLWKNLNLAG
jgi:hypothetical protein